MIKIEKTEVFNFDGALRGLRNPMNSWDKADSGLICIPGKVDDAYMIGPNDLNLCHRMLNGGTEEAKFMRQIFVSVDITAPLYWWKEFDTYKIGTVANSCSTMHKIQAKEFTPDDFSIEHLDLFCLKTMKDTIATLNHYRELYNENKHKDDWWQMIQLLPSSYNQKRTVTLNYQVLRSIYFQRRHHKLDEWHTLCDWIENLPYGKELICYEKGNKLETIHTPDKCQSVTNVDADGKPIIGKNFGTVYKDDDGGIIYAFDRR